MLLASFYRDRGSTGGAGPRVFQSAARVGGIHFEQGRFDEAGEIYRKAISYDELSEAAHRGLMRCFVRQGERGQALKYYEELAELLDEKLGSSPASEPSALYERLRRGENI